jgi:hypothetical protein
LNLAILSDFDGTIANIDTGAFILAKFAEGDWRIFDEQLERGQIDLQDYLSRRFSLLTLFMAKARRFFPHSASCVPRTLRLRRGEVSALRIDGCAGWLACNVSKNHRAVSNECSPVPQAVLGEPLARSEWALRIPLRPSAENRRPSCPTSFVVFPIEIWRFIHSFIHLHD